MTDLPEGANELHPLWQQGYDDGFNGIGPVTDDPIYASGWRHGHNGANQCPFEDSERAYRETKGLRLGRL